MDDEEFFAQLAGDTSNMLSEWEEQRKQERNAAKMQLKQLLAAHPKISKITVVYDGSGDSGCFEGHKYLDGEGNAIEADVLNDAVDEYTCSILPGGWEIDGGSYGYVEIDVTNGESKITFTERSDDYFEIDFWFRTSDWPETTGNDWLCFTKIQITYEGCGDSCCFDEHTYLDSSGFTVEAKVLNDAIKFYACSILPVFWVNDDGSYWEVEVDAFTGKVKVNRTERFIQDKTMKFEIDNGASLSPCP